MNHVLLKKTEILGAILAFVGGVLWGFSGVCGQYLFMYKDISAEFLVPYRLLFAGLVLLGFYAIKTPKILTTPLKDKKLLFPLFLYGIIGLMMTQYTYFYAIERSNAAIATVIQYTAPAMILVVVCFSEARLPKFVEILALSFAIIGVFLLSTHGDFKTFVVSKAAIISAFLSAVCFCFYSLLGIRLNSKYPVGLNLGWGLIIGSVLLFCYTKPWQLNGISDFGGFLCMVFIVFFGTVFAFSSYMLGIKFIGASKASLIACVEPVSAAVFAHFWLDVEFVFLDFVGFVLILSCVFLTAKRYE